MRKLFLYSLITIFTILGFSSCLTKPDLPKQPTISFNSLFFRPQDISKLDSISIGINFKDGDGDIGLTTADTSGKFAPRNPDGSRNEFYFNFYYKILKRNKFSGEYEVINALLDQGRVPPLLERAQPGPIEGQLFYYFDYDFINAFDINGNIINLRRDSVKFEVFIYDKSLNKSNTIRTSAIYVNP